MSITKVSTGRLIGDGVTLISPWIGLIGSFGPLGLKPTVTAGISTALNLLCHAAFYGLFGEKPRQQVQRPKKWLWYAFIATLVLLAIYILLSVFFVGDYKGEKRFVRGFVLSQDGEKYLKQMTGKEGDFSQADKDAAMEEAQLDPYTIYQAWSVNLIQYGMIVVWFLIFIAVCFIWSVYKFLYPDVPLPTTPPLGEPGDSP